MSACAILHIHEKPLHQTKLRKKKGRNWWAKIFFNAESKFLFFLDLSVPKLLPVFCEVLHPYCIISAEKNTWTFL